MNKRVAILVDGGFYRKQSFKVKGELSPEARATELYEYCWRHLAEGKKKKSDLMNYIVFFIMTVHLSQKEYTTL